MKKWLKKLWIRYMYSYALTNAYILQECSPIAAAQFLTDADKWQMELWRIERGMV